MLTTASHRRRRARAAALATLTALAATLLVLAAPAPAGATTFTVTVDGDSGAGTFGAAIAAAEGDEVGGPHVIEFTPGLTINPTTSFFYNNPSGVPLTIEGNGATVDLGDQDVRFLFVAGAAPVTINDLTIRDADAVIGGSALFQNGTGAITLNDVTFTGLVAEQAGGAVRINQAAATLTVNRSTFIGNQSETQTGGAIQSSGASVTITDSYFADNSAGTSGGALITNGALTIERSTFAGNTATDNGAAVQNFTTPTIVRNTTFVDNDLTGAFSGSALTGGGLQIDHSLFSGNDGAATNVGQVSFAEAGAVLTNSVLVDPGPDDRNCAGNDINRDTGYTISSDVSCFPGTSGGLEEGDVENFAGDIALGPLRDNGGLVPTRFPLAGSPVLDGGPAVGPTSNCSLADDARSVARPFPAGATHCDLGPVEATYPPSTLSDVPAWAADAIAWITSSVNDPRLMEGFNDDTFRPADPITRGQVVRMLYRLMGEPDVTSLTHPFTDVPNWVEPAVLWAYNTGAPDDRIVTGVTATKFKPADPITRGQVVRMLYRTVGSPDITGMPAHPFSDVPNWVEEAVTWAANTDNPLPLFTGITPTLFRPANDITRAQVARSSYRMAITPAVWNTAAAPTVPFVAPTP